MSAQGRAGKVQTELTIAIVGVGLIGGSLGLAWRAAKAARVIGIVRRPESVDEVVAVGACDEATLDLAAGVQRADVVVVCTPVTSIVPTVEKLLPYLRKGTIVTDAGSTKREICEQLWRALPPGVHFIGGHPMAGSERDGVAAADPYLFENAAYVLTPPAPPTAETDAALHTLKSLVELTGAHTMVMDAKRHDLIVAAVSHVPHLTAAALVHAASQVNSQIPDTLNLAAGGFRDTTRIASGSAPLWRDICHTNSAAITQVLDLLIEDLRSVRSQLVHGDMAGLENFLAKARHVRSQVPNRSKGILTSLCEIVVQVIDRPGEIAKVTELLAEGQINVIDIEILRVREGEGGTLRLGFEAEPLRDEALRTLTAHGYSARIR